jgi:hypothetical protein
MDLTETHCHDTSLADLPSVFSSETSEPGKSRRKSPRENPLPVMPSHLDLMKAKLKKSSIENGSENTNRNGL